MSDARLPAAKADPKCGCVTGFYECWHCRKPKLQRIWNNMTPEQRAYDRYVAPGMAAQFDRDRYDFEPQGCSCHINPPCSFCTREADEDESTPSPEQPL